MIVTQSKLDLSTSHFATKETLSKESLTLAESGNREARGKAPNLMAPATAPSARGGEMPVQISEAGRQNLHADNANAVTSPNRQLNNDPRLSVLLMAVEMLTGRKVNLLDAELRDPKSTESSSKSYGLRDPQSGASTAYNARSPSSGTYRRDTSYTETEYSGFSAQGMVRTADGREINFQIDLEMFRAFHSEEHVEINFGKPRDPLVLNFSGLASALSDMTFKFDLMGNGGEVDMRALQSGSGFLVFDRNGDGKVNDGRELFGTASGDGFAELAALDDDGNGWIDENDRAFSQLYVWNRDSNGNDVMKSLKDVGVGAIALTYANTPFSLKDANNALLGQITDTSVFLTEKGGVGTIQKVDVVV